MIVFKTVTTTTTMTLDGGEQKNDRTEACGRRADFLESSATAVEEEVLLATRTTSICVYV